MTTIFFSTTVYISTDEWWSVKRFRRLHLVTSSSHPIPFIHLSIYSIIISTKASRKQDTGSVGTVVINLHISFSFPPASLEPIASVAVRTGCPASRITQLP